MDFEGKRALVTGGSKGIGRAIAQALVDRGSKVGIMARRRDVLEKTASRMGVLAVAGDVAREEDAVNAVNAFVRELGGIDILVNNAGIGYGDVIQSLDMSRFRQVMDVNVFGTALMTQAAVPHFIEQKSGHIVNISSTAGTKGFARGTAYVASKFALKGMTECWRAELRPHNVRVILVNPSEVQTGWGGRGEPEVKNPKKLVSEDVADGVLGALAMAERGFIPEFSIWATNPF